MLLIECSLLFILPYFYLQCFFDLHTLGIWNTTQPNGLAVPDASMHPVKSTADVLEFMNIGLMNRAVGATALNERSSRSHRFLKTLILLVFWLWRFYFLNVFACNSNIAVSSLSMSWGQT